MPEMQTSAAATNTSKEDFSRDMAQLPWANKSLPNLMRRQSKSDGGLPRRVQSSGFEGIVLSTPDK